jgi:hypothetical protein
MAEALLDLGRPAEALAAARAAQGYCDQMDDVKQATRCRAIADRAEMASAAS